MSTLTEAKAGSSPASVWAAASESALGDELLEWPPDLFALAAVVLIRSEVYRFAFSPPSGSSWPPTRFADWADAVTRAGREWAAWVEDTTREVPSLLAEEWEVFRAGENMPLEDLARARDWRMCEALLTLHAMADEACAGLGVALTASDGEGSAYRARGREVLARTGTLSRIPSRLLRVLPKVRTSPGGSSPRALSRYACVHGPGIDARWHKVPGRAPGTELRAQATNFLLLPWPLRVRQSDFRPVDHSVGGPAAEPSGLFEFDPLERLDLDLVDRMLVAAKDEVESVQVVVFPESAVGEDELDGLEAVLDHHGVNGLIAGVRRPARQPGRVSSNWVHIAVSAGDHHRVRIRQNKHHRWSLDASQIYQYHLGGVLHPRVRWWESIDVPRRSLQLVEVGEGVTFASLVCEDLAQIDQVAELLRSVGPTIVITPLLDGPQLSSRWAARYASVLADDPGSAVLTLTSSGMGRRSRPPGREPSPVVALWRDPSRGTREIPLEPGAQGVLLTATADAAARRSGDGRRPIGNCTEFFDVGVFQVRAAAAGTGVSMPVSTRSEPALDLEELTILTSWAEAVAETLAFAPERVETVLAEAHPRAPWRAPLEVAAPSARLSSAFASMHRRIRAATATVDPLTLDTMLDAIPNGRPDNEVEQLADLVLRSALEQRYLRQARDDRRVGDCAR